VRHDHYDADTIATRVAAARRRGDPGRSDSIGQDSIGQHSIGQDGSGQDGSDQDGSGQAAAQVPARYVAQARYPSGASREGQAAAD